MARLCKGTRYGIKGEAAVISSCLPNEARSSSYPSGADTTFIYNNIYVAIRGFSFRYVL